MSGCLVLGCSVLITKVTKGLLLSWLTPAKLVEYAGKIRLLNPAGEVFSGVVCRPLAVRPALFAAGGWQNKPRGP